MRTILILVSMAVVLLALACNAAAPDPQAQEKREQGFHCLSSWDGQHSGFDDLVRSRLNDPDSMKVIGTQVGRVQVNGQHVIVMEFTAANAFGGRVRHTANGQFDNATCQAKLLSIQ